MWKYTLEHFGIVIMKNVPIQTWIGEIYVLTQKVIHRKKLISVLSAA